MHVRRNEKLTPPLLPYTKLLHYEVFLGKNKCTRFVFVRHIVLLVGGLCLQLHLVPSMASNINLFAASLKN